MLGFNSHRCCMGILVITVAGVFCQAPVLHAQINDQVAVLEQQRDDVLSNTNVWTRTRWSPYAVGIGIGVLSWLAFLFSDHPLGVSTAYVRTSGMIEEMLRGPEVREREYYKKYEPTVDWEWMLVAGLVVGAFASAMLSGDFRIEWAPPTWEAAYGLRPVWRWVAALVGGFLIGLGSRWAGGCTSGHGISGTLQLVVSSWVAVVCFFLGGVAAAFFMYYVLG